MDKDVAKPGFLCQAHDFIREILKIKKSADLSPTTHPLPQPVFYTIFVDNIVRKIKDGLEDP